MLIATVRANTPAQQYDYGNLLQCFCHYEVFAYA